MATVLALSDLTRLGWGPALVPIAPGSKRPGVNGADGIGWQSKTWAPAELDAAEKRGCSFGVRFNVPELPAAALDCDAEGATADAAPVVADVARRLLGEGARRNRDGTTRFAIAYRVAAVGAGKRAARFQRGADSFSVELFDGSGQVLFGPKHSTGAAYLWDKAPDYAALPVVTVDGPALFAELARALKPLGYTLAGTVAYGNADALERDAEARAADPLWRALVARGAVLFEQREGRAAIRCPFEHASGKGKPRKRDSGTAYLPPLLEGADATGYISCLHASCAGRSQAEFATALGVELPADPVIEFPLPPIPEIPRSLDSGFEEMQPPTRTRKPAPMGPEAYRGPFGAAAELFATCCEASREALLLQTLIAFSAIPDRAGVSIGRRRPGGSALQVLLVGPTAQGRKGTSLAFVRDLLEEAFPAFVLGVKPSADGITMPAPSRMLYGLSSGEGIVNAIRDARLLGKEIDPGADDKRLCVILEEFSLLLKAARRDGNTLSEILRAIHDGAPLQFPTKREPLFASRSHVAAIAHCTTEELTTKIDALELVNGALNRWLIGYAERARIDAEPPDPDEKQQSAIAATLRARLAPYAYTPGQEWSRRALPLTPAAAALWRGELYALLDAGARGGTAHALTVRYTAHAKRLALLYALGDGVSAIGVEHLRAAAAVLAYCEASMHYVFGTDTYPDAITQRVADVIREAQGALVPRALVWKALGHGVPAARIDAAIATLHEAGAVRVLRGPRAPNGIKPWYYQWQAGK